MSRFTLIVFLWFVVLTEQNPWNSTVSALCRTGFAYVRCDVNKCKNALGPVWPTLQNRTNTDQLYLQLFKDGQVIESSKSVRNATFKIAFKNMEGAKSIGFECVWRRKQTHVCRQKVLVDLHSLPAPAQQLFTLAHSRGHKMIVVKFNESRRIYNRTSESASVSVSWYSNFVRCPAKNLRPLKSQTGSCTKNGTLFVCHNLYKGLLIYPGTLVTIATVENQAGSCNSSPLCKKLTYFDVYGGLQDVAVRYEVAYYTIRLLVSWKVPRYLRIDVHFEVEYCSMQCRKQKIKRDYYQLKTNVVTAKIDRNVAYKSEYSIRVRYKIGIYETSDFSPWTSPVYITTPSEIPKNLPIVNTCAKKFKTLTVQWRNEGVDYYLLRIEQSGQRDIFSKIYSRNCKQESCAFSFEKGSLKNALRIAVFPCSEYGCNNKSTKDSSCTFKASHLLDRSSSSEHTSESQRSEILLATLPFAALILLAAPLLALKVYQRWNAASSFKDVPPVFPRPYSSSDSSYLHSSHSTERFTGYDPLVKPEV